MKIKISLPGGAGGNWLGHLIHCLEINEFTPAHGVINYHKHYKSSNVTFTHDVSDKTMTFFNSNHPFNIYLNVVKKLRFHDSDILNTCTIQERFEILASEASSKLFFLEERTDLSWDDIFLDSNRFIQALYALLDQHNLVFTKNDLICNAAINEYRSTCVDPWDHYNNFDSIYWLGWCNGVCKHEFWDWPLVDSVEQMQNFLLPRRDFFCEYTKKYILEIQ